jgi:hypothetical protein
MTDAERAAAELAETLRTVNEELANTGRVSQATSNARRDAEMKAKYGIENFTAGTAKGAEAVAGLASAGMAAGRAMLEGKKGASAFNGSLDELSKVAQATGVALALMIPGGLLIKGFIAAVTLATTSLIKYTQAANEMADKLYKGFSGLAKVGAAASDGMTGVKNGAQKLGLSMNELGDYVQIVSENSRDLANLGGSVYKGRQALENMGKAMEPARESMLKMGLMPKDVAEGMAGYLRTQTRLGYAQRMTVDQLADGAKKYLIEQDALTKLTGVERAEREKMREEALMEQQFAGVIRKLELQGKGEEAKRLMDINEAASSLDKEFGKLVRSAMTGNLSNEAAQKLLMSAPDVFATLQKGQKGVLEPMEVTARIARQVGKTADKLVELAPLEAFNDTFVDMGLSQKLRIAEEKGLSAALAEAKAEQVRQGVTGKKAADGILEGQAKLIDAQVKATRAVENFISIGIGPAQDATALLADKAAMAAAGLSDLVGASQGYLTKLKEMAKPVADTATKGLEAVQKTTGGAGAELVGSTGGAGAGGIAGAIVGGLLGLLGGPAGAVVGAKWGSVIGSGLGATIGLYLGRDAKKNVEGERAAGGPVDAGKLYRVGERGEEFFRPNVAGQIVPNDQIAGITSGANNRIEIIERAAKEIANDTVTLAKLTDVDLKKTQDFSRMQDRLRKLKTDLGLEEVELLEEQKNELTKMLNDMEKTMGKDKADAARRNIIMQRAMGAMVSGGGTGLQMFGSGMGGGTGLQMPTASSMPSMGGGQGLQVKNQDDLKNLGLRIKQGDVQAEGAAISPKLIELAKAVQSNVPGFGMFTGFNDKFHNEKAPSSQHTKGLAMDFTVARPPSVQDGKAVTDWLKQMGATLAIDEYNNPSSNSTGGHFHAQIPAFANGGLVDDATLSLIGEAGPEAVIPLKDGNVPVSFNGKMGMGDEAMGLFKIMAEQTATMAAMMEEMVRVQKNGNDISNKMLRMQS